MNLKENARKDKIAKKFITDLCVFIYFINNRDNGVWILKVYPRNSFFIFERRLVANTLIIILLQKIKFFSFNTRLIHHFNPVFFFIITIIIIKYIFRQRSNVRMKNKDLKKRFFFHRISDQGTYLHFIVDLQFNAGDRNCSHSVYRTFQLTNDFLVPHLNARTSVTIRRFLTPKSFLYHPNDK